MNGRRIVVAFSEKSASENTIRVSSTGAQHPAESKCLEIIHKSPFQRPEMVAGQNQEMVTWTFVVGTGNSGVPHPDL